MNLKDTKQELMYLVAELESLPDLDEAQILMGQANALLKKVEEAKKVSRDKFEEFKLEIDKEYADLQHDFEGIIDTLPASERY